jgi:hypothetical protein
MKGHPCNIHNSSSDHPPTINQAIKKKIAGQSFLNKLKAFERLGTLLCRITFNTHPSSPAIAAKRGRLFQCL